MGLPTAEAGFLTPQPTESQGVALEGSLLGRSTPKGSRCRKQNEGPGGQGYFCLLIAALQACDTSMLITCYTYILVTY